MTKRISRIREFCITGPFWFYTGICFF